MMRECAWPTGCFQRAYSDDPENLCYYHRLVADGLISLPLPDVLERDIIEENKRKKEKKK